MNTTIAAISTAVSASGIGIIRISGPEAMDVISPVSYTHLDVYKRQLIRHGIFSHHHADMGFILFKADNLPVFASFMGFAGSAQIHRLQDICFSLCIIPIKNISSFVKRKFQRFVISEIA